MLKQTAKVGYLQSVTAPDPNNGENLNRTVFENLTKRKAPAVIVENRPAPAYRQKILLCKVCCQGIPVFISFNAHFRYIETGHFILRIYPDHHYLVTYFKEQI